MSVLPAVYFDYPNKFPLADQRGYAVDVDAGLLRSSLRQGVSSQRRGYQNSPTRLAVAFRMSAEDAEEWVAWANNYGYSWFSMPVFDQYSGFVSIEDMVNVPSQIVRFASNLQMLNIGYNYVSIECDLEIRPQDIGDGTIGDQDDAIAQPTSDFIIAGTAEDPSADWVLSGTPGTLPTDWILAETPTDHY